MPQFEFRVLCSSHKTCGTVMEGMKKMKYSDVMKRSNLVTSDHSAKLALKNENEAYEKAQQLLAKYPEKIHDVTVISS